MKDFLTLDQCWVSMSGTSVGTVVSLERYSVDETPHHWTPQCCLHTPVFTVHWTNSEDTELSHAFKPFKF